MIRPMPLAELVEDFNVYPRHCVDDQHVSALAEALRAGETLPAIVAEEKSKRIVDGVHRSRALKMVLGPSAVVDVDCQIYASELDLVVDAVQRNACHGRKLDRIDQVRSVLMIEHLGGTRTMAAQAMHLTRDRVDRMAIRTAHAPGPGPGVVPGTDLLPLKRPILHLNSHHLSAAQVLAARSAPGVSYMLTAGQLLEGLRADLLNLQDVRLVERLRELYSELRRVLSTLP